MAKNEPGGHDSGDPDARRADTEEQAVAGARGAGARPDAAEEAALAERLDGLSRTLRRHRVAAASGEASRGGGDSGYARAVKIGSEFVAGIVVGTGLGWVIDRGLGTKPWGMILFLLIGFAAGVLNVMRAEGMVAPAGIRRPDGPETSEGRGPGDGPGPAAKG